MARRTGSRIKLSRRYGSALFNTPKEAKILQRRGYPPGQHGPSANTRVSEYGLQLREKQKAKIMYGLLERQFRKYYTEALRQAGNTSFRLLQILELRLDNVIYRLGFAATRAQARQIVSHGHTLVRGRLVNIPSFRVSIGDEISIRPQSATKAGFALLSKSIENVGVPSWLELNKTTLTGKVLSLPENDHIERNIDAQRIVEFYSR